MTKPLFLFDLDGPLIDVSERYYRLYCDLLKEANLVPISKEQYWQLKRQKISEAKIFARSSDANSADYERKRLELIESPQYMIYDRLHDGALKILEIFEKKYDLVLVTLRSSRVLLEEQLFKFDLNRYFCTVLSSGEAVSPRWKLKEKLVTDYLQGSRHVVGIVGDTETDLSAGKALGCRFKIFVDSGIREQKIFEKSQADYFLNHVLDLRQLVEEGIL